MDPSSIETMSLHCTDALPNRQIVEHTFTKTISARVLERVEKELEEFEKISILFLITAEDPRAYEKILGLCRNVGERPNIIAEFVENNFDLWGERLLESLCIINNREVLKNLGFDPENLAQRYRQNITRSAVKIHPVSKVLYKLFETMDAEKAKILLRSIYQEDRVERQLEDNHYLELHALYWLHIRYITISPDGGGDLSKLLKHVKGMSYYGQLIYQDVEYYSTTLSQSDSSSTEKTLPIGCLKQHELLVREKNERLLPEKNERFVRENNERVLSEKNERFVPEQNEISTREDMTYAIKKGMCVIVNEENFSTRVRNEYPRREGTRKDRDNLRRTFKGLGFDVEVHDDLTRDEISREFKRVSDNFDEKIHDCLVVAILSHGYEGGIVSSDGNEIPIDVIENAVCTWELRNVIKILIIQACQGKKMGDVSRNSRLALDGPSRMTERKSENILRFAHYARFMSTMKGFSSIRHKEQGSWFIQAACEVLSDRRSISVDQWSLRVKKKVRGKVGSVNEVEFASQIPVYTSQLEDEVYFPPYEEKPSGEEREKLIHQI